MDGYIISLLITLAVAAAGSALFLRLRVPAGALVGALIFTACLKVFTNVGEMPAFVKTGVQIIAGAFVGQRVRMRDLKEMRTIIKPVIVYLSCVVFLIIGMGFVIERLTILDLPTALLSVLPGGVTEIAMISEELGANAMHTTVLQMSRYIYAVLLLPQIDALICARYDKSGEGIAPQSEGDRKNVKNAALTIVLCSAAGMLGKLSGVPAGALVFSLVAAAVISVRTDSAYMPKPIRYAAQNLAGCLLGVTVTMADIQRFPTLALPVLLVLLNCSIINFGCSAILRRVSNFSLSTRLFSCVPAGVSDMALVSLELGGDAPKVMVMQLARYLLVLGVMPTVIRLLTSLA